jgi:hypothetical protein
MVAVAADTVMKQLVMIKANAVNRDKNFFMILNPFNFFVWYCRPRQLRKNFNLYSRAKNITLTPPLALYKYSKPAAKTIVGQPIVNSPAPMPLSNYFLRLYLLHFSFISLELSYFIKRPNSDFKLAHDLLFRNTAYLTASRIHRNASVVSHYKDSFVRHLIGKFEVTFAVRFFTDIRLVNLFAVDLYRAVL